MSQSSTDTDTTSYPRLDAVGDSAILVQFGDGSDDNHNTAALAFAADVRQAAFDAVIDCAPAIRSVLIRYNPLLTRYQEMAEAIQQRLDTTNWLAAPLPSGRKLWALPVCYDEHEAVDLLATAELLQLDVDALIASHGQHRQRLYAIGFAPGHIYTGKLAPNWNFNRLDYIKPSVPAGAVCVAIRQTVIFASAMPTGWRMIGRTPLRNFDVRRDPACLLQAGDEIQFTPIDRSSLERLTRQAELGTLALDSERLP